MCLYPRLIKNPKYTANKKNGGAIPAVTDNRVLYVPIGCDNCIECKKQKANSHRARLLEEIKTAGNGYFVTLTLSTESFQKYWKKQPQLCGYTADNYVITTAFRYFYERWRKHHKKLFKYWLVSELGGNGTENVHLHGIIWTDKYLKIRTGKNKGKYKNAAQEIKDIWADGYVYIGDYVNEKTVNYAVKYITKTDPKHKHYKPVNLNSNGLGANYTNTHNFKLNKYKPEGENKQQYVTRQGTKINLPNYWKNKLFTDQEKELLWIEKLNKQERYVLGQKIDVSKGMDQYLKAIETAREINSRLGYQGIPNYDQKKYEETLRTLKHIERIEKMNKKSTKGMEDAPF